MGVALTVLRSTNDGQSWQPVHAGLPMSYDLTGVWGEGLTWVAVATEFQGPGHILRSTDGGLTWMEVEIPEPPQQLFGVWGRGATIVAVGREGAILRSGDGGVTWTSIPSGTTAWLRGIQGDASMIWVVGDDGVLLQSTDDGLSWNRRGVTSLSDHAIRAVWMTGPENVVAVGGGGLILRGTR